MADIVRVRFEGDDSDLTKAFKDAGAGAKSMAEEIDQAARDSTGSIDRMDSTGRAGLGRLNDGVEGSVGKFRGFKDTIDGTTDIAEGFATGDVSTILGGFADLADGVASTILPKLASMADSLTNKIPAAADDMAEASIAASTRAGVGFKAMLGTAGVIGFTLLGLVEGARQAKEAIDDIASGKGIWESVTKPRGWFSPLGDPLEDFKDMLGFHTGGVFPGVGGREGLAMLQAGETVVPRGSSKGGMGSNVVINVSGVGMGRDFGNVIAQTIRDNKLIGLT
jgi:hypothetical protein